MYEEQDLMDFYRPRDFIDEMREEIQKQQQELERQCQELRRQNLELEKQNLELEKQQLELERQCQGLMQVIALFDAGKITEAKALLAQHPEYRSQASS